MGKSYNDLLQEVLKEIYEVKDLDNKDRGKRLSIFIGERLDKELILSSINILTLFVDILDVNKQDFLIDLRSKDWYEEWFINREGYKYVDLNNIDILTMQPFEIKEFCSNYTKYNIADKIEPGKFKLLDLLYNEKLFITGAYNFLLNNGFFKHKEYDIFDLPSDLANDKDIVKMMVLLNKDNINYIGDLDIDLSLNIDININTDSRISVR